MQDPTDATLSLTTSVADWGALPAGSVRFDHDVDTGDVVLTVLDYAPVILVTYNDGLGGGGTAPLYLTQATDVQVTAGADSYNSGSVPDLSFLTAPEAPPVPKPDNLSDEEYQALWDAYLAAREMPDGSMPSGGNHDCGSCHAPNAQYFGVAVTPTQIARFTDAELLAILTDGQKPAGVGFYVLPADLLGQTAEENYAAYHMRDGTPAELQALIIYLRSLTPAGRQIPPTP